MKTVLSILPLLLSATMALPASDGLKCGFSTECNVAPMVVPRDTVEVRDVQPCGPNSNCELVNINGVESYQFRPGYEPGTDDYRARFPTLTKRQSPGTGDLWTKVTIGRTRIQYGCDANVWEEIRGALDENCVNACDAGTPKQVQRQQWENSQKKPTDATLSIKTSGSFLNEVKRATLADALLRTIRPDTVTQTPSTWRERHTPSANNRGMIDTEGQCIITTFPNFVSVERFRGDDLQDRLQIDAEFVEVKKECLAAGILKNIAEGIHGAASAAMGAIQTHCLQN